MSIEDDGILRFRFGLTVEKIESSDISLMRTFIFYFAPCL